jgi:carboxypeptidase Q
MRAALPTLVPAELATVVAANPAEIVPAPRQAPDRPACGRAGSRRLFGRDESRWVPAFAGAPLLLGLVGLVLAQAPAPAAPYSPATLATATQLREAALQGSGAFAIVESLTTEVGPRLAGTPADARAVAWAKTHFETLGFDRVYTEPVTFPAWHRGHEHAEIVAPFPQRLALTALGGSVGTDGPLEAEIVAFPNLQALIDAPADAAKGRIVFIANRMERFKDGRGYGPAVAARARGAVEAAKKGARAVLIRSIGTDSARLPHTGTMRYEDGVARIPAAALSNPDADQLARALERGKPVRVKLDLEAGMDGEAISYNVIGEIRGRSHPEEVVVIGGHLDSWDLGTGAIDDGAGVAITMAAGALIGKLDTPPERTIRVIAFANEEQGLFGGKAYAAAHAGEEARHVIGAESDFGAGRIYAFSSNAPADKVPALLEIAKLLEPLGIDWTPAKGSAGPDVGPMAAQGMVWGWLGQDGSDYFNYHHTADDTLDKIEPAALDQQAAAYAVFAYLAAQTEGGLGSRKVEPAAGASTGAR